MDKSSKESAVKLEPRIVKVLEILIRHSPSVVTREQLIEEVWDNYGGAEDALNHAVSQLRKVLNDTDRQNRIIETIPKKGYRLRKVEKVRSRKYRRWLVWGFSLVLFLFLAYFSYQYFNRTGTAAPPAPDGKTVEHSSNTHPVPKAED